MPSRRQIREAAIQFLYCADLEGGAAPSELREPFWEFVTESDRRSLQIAMFKTVHHLAQGREGRLAEFLKRQSAANELLGAWPEAELLKTTLEQISKLENKWSMKLAQMEKLPKEGDHSTVADNFGTALEALFRVDRDLEMSRARFLSAMEEHAKLRGRLEAVAASVRRLQRISDRMRMVEAPEKFPEQADLSHLRDSKVRMHDLRRDADELTDQIIKHKTELDASLAKVVENYAPERIDPVDRAILRLAAYEISKANIPTKVAINEAIELAKRFGTSDSKRFVNGVLDQLAKSFQQDSETA